MEVLGIGFNELVFIFIIALIVLGPRDMQKAGKTIGRWLRTLVTSDGWKVFQQTSRELRTLPNRLMREANDELEQINNEVKGVTGTQPRRPETPPPSRSQAIPDNNIAPPRIEPKPDGDDPESNA
jgi:Sec-independent protein translocase protein TatA